MWLIGLLIGGALAVFAIVKVARFLNAAGDQPHETDDE